MVDVLGAERSTAVCRELTKIHEEIWRGTLAEARHAWTKRKPRGEFTLVVNGATPVPDWDETRVKTALTEALAVGATTKDAIRQITDQSGWSRREVYALAQRIKDTWSSS